MLPKFRGWSGRHASDISCCGAADVHCSAKKLAKRVALSKSVVAVCSAVHTAWESEIDRLMPLINLASNGSNWVCAASFYLRSAAIQVNQTCIK